MIRTTIMLPNDLKTRAFREAQKMGISLGEFIRESIFLKLQGQFQESKTDPLLNDHALFKGQTPSDLASKHDKYLFANDADA